MQTLLILALDYYFGGAPMERVAVISGALLGLPAAALTNGQYCCLCHSSVDLSAEHVGLRVGSRPGISIGA